MSGYTPYYSGGWQSGESGGTPITPAALNNMESGIGAALTAANVVDNLTNPSSNTIPSTAAVANAIEAFATLKNAKRKEGNTITFTVSTGNTALLLMGEGFGCNAFYTGSVWYKTSFGSVTPTISTNDNIISFSDLGGYKSIIAIAVGSGYVS